jgi:hypothetical protein
MTRSLSIALAVALTAGSGVALAKTLHGTGRNDTLIGTPGATGIGRVRLTTDEQLRGLDVRCRVARMRDSRRRVVPNARTDQANRKPNRTG